jgi:hypothetical protein
MLINGKLQDGGVVQAGAMITRRHFLASAAGAQAAQRRPPNIVLILTDDQGWWDVSRNGNPAIASLMARACCRHLPSARCFTSGTASALA